ncbi:MAG TPA: DUF1501 domain-containing protein [Stellaceae bacterium]|nr:DUF1501 domain-containing protein [Stellaceae bacterium]
MSKGPSLPRRAVLRASAGMALLPLGRAAWAATAAGGPQRLIVVLLRGAVDGLNVVVPYAEEAYYAARPTIAIARPGTPGGVLALDARFGLHPALSSLLPLWREGTLGFIHAAGSPDPNRSHFEAQRYIENGTPGDSTTPDGWMNRLLQTLPGPHDPAEAISLGPTLPRILSGSAPATNLELGPEAARPLPIDQPRLAAAFDRLYAGDDALARAYREGRQARSEVLADLAREAAVADAGAPPPRSFAARAARLGRLIGGDPRIRLAFIALGGWDTHVAEGGHQGQLANRLRPLGDGLAALAGGLGTSWRDTVIVVLSEFGRTVHENGDRGTDHGHGNVIWVAGGAINGGRVYGEWPGLAPDQLYQHRDLAITTDFRAALAAILSAHLHLRDDQLDRVFPDAPPVAAGLTRLLSA